MISRIYRLTFSGPLHLSSGGFGLGATDEIIRSDTLYSAVCSVAATLMSKDELAGIFFNLEHPGIILSSAFPHYEGQLFFPKPLGWLPANSDKLLGNDRKRLKKVKHVSSEIFNKIIAGMPVDFPLSNDNCDNPQDRMIASNCWSEQEFSVIEPDGKLKKAKNLKLFKVLEMPRVTLDRMTQDATLFHLAQIEFREGAGLFFIGKFKDDNAKKSFEMVLSALSETGIGGDRSVGRGQFQFASEDFSFPTIDQSDGFVSLSLFMPGEGELTWLNLQESSYDFTLRQGWVHNNSLRRRTFRFFTEGSTFRTTAPAFTIKGKLAMALGVTEFPNLLAHDVYRSGLALTVPMRFPINSAQ